MSLILTWDNPQESFTPVLHHVEIWRGTPDPFAGNQPIATDAPWGLFEDLNENNELQQYAVVYVDYGGGWTVIINNFDIRRYKRPDDTCKISFNLVQPDGSPDSGRDIEISDEPSGSAFTRRIVTNLKGHAIFFGKYGRRLLLRIDGREKALDFVVPKTREISHEALRGFGTEIESDRRGLV
jgi:hypothetical protein